MNVQPWELGGKALKMIAAAKTPKEAAIIRDNWTTYMDDRFKVGVVAGYVFPRHSMYLLLTPPSIPAFPAGPSSAHSAR